MSPSSYFNFEIGQVMFKMQNVTVFAKKHWLIEWELGSLRVMIPEDFTVLFIKSVYLIVNKAVELSNCQQGPAFKLRIWEDFYYLLVNNLCSFFKVLMRFHCHLQTASFQRNLAKILCHPLLLYSFKVALWFRYI